MFCTHDKPNSVLSPPCSDSDGHIPGMYVTIHLLRLSPPHFRNRLHCCSVRSYTSLLQNVLQSTTKVGLGTALHTGRNFAVSFHTLPYGLFLDNSRNLSSLDLSVTVRIPMHMRYVIPHSHRQVLPATILHHCEAEMGVFGLSSQPHFFLEPM